MNFFDNAVRTHLKYKAAGWSVGRYLMYAVDEEGKTVRDFCRAVDGKIDKEDTYARWMNANRFKDFIQKNDIPLVEFLNNLEITYWAEAWTGLDDGWKLEDLLSTLQEAEQDPHKNIRWFRAKRAEATGKTGKLFRRLDKLRKKLSDYSEEYEKLEGDVNGLRDAMGDVSVHAECVIQEHEWLWKPIRNQVENLEHLSKELKTLDKKDNP